MVKMVMKMVNMVKMVIRFDNSHFWLENFSTTQDENAPKSLHEIKISLESIAWTTNSLVFHPRSKLREILSSLTKNHSNSLNFTQSSPSFVQSCHQLESGCHQHTFLLNVSLKAQSRPTGEWGFFAMQFTPKHGHWTFETKWERMELLFEVSKSVFRMHWKMLLLSDSIVN